tara:strand:+ start:288 stop:1202 length:915 start_codon:yes stop_codon:yes gene_type:complete
MSNLVKKTDPKYVDLLDEDKAISGQKFACMSFVSPEKILKQKEMFFFEKFLKNWDFQKSLEKYAQFLNYLSFKYNLKFDDLTNDLQDFVKDQRENLLSNSIEDEYKNFLDNKEEQLEKEFNSLHNFQTSTRGIKVRGSFPTQEEAELRCKMLREVDPNHDVYVAPVGVWVPWHPEAYKTGRVEYLEEELNEIMNEKRKNEESAKQQFEKRVKETKRKAIEENIKNAEKSGNMLSQTIDKEGNLINMAMTENFDENETVTSADIRKELFEGDNIVTSSNKKELHQKAMENKIANSMTNKDDESKE